ncbi:MAG: hypothetical protein M1524_01610 [Patescibacteria group bacterium]|nr:hypothetical protein [Patescibacteria group bacterium]
MKIVVTHTSPDLDAITSVWLIRKFLPGWDTAQVKYVQAGEKLNNVNTNDPIEKNGTDEIIHVDTGLGALDHHQIKDQNVSAASLSWEFIKNKNPEFIGEVSERIKDKIAAIDRMVKIVVEIDHFREVFWKDAVEDNQEFTLSEILEGLKLSKPDSDDYYLDFGIKALDAVLANFENRVWAEKEIEKNGSEFQTSFGKAIGFETLNDSVLKLAQRMGYVLVVRKDPRKGYVRIKTLPPKTPEDKGIDLTLAYEKLKKMDPEATWYLHVSGKMLLNGTTKNPNMRPTKLSLDDIVKVLKEL